MLSVGFPASKKSIKRQLKKRKRDYSAIFYRARLGGCFGLRFCDLGNDSLAALIKKRPSSVCSKDLEVRFTRRTPRRDSSELCALLIAAGKEFNARAAAERFPALMISTKSCISASSFAIGCRSLSSTALRLNIVAASPLSRTSEHEGRVARDRSLHRTQGWIAPFVATQGIHRELISP